MVCEPVEFEPGGGLTLFRPRRVNPTKTSPTKNTPLSRQPRNGEAFEMFSGGGVGTYLVTHPYRI